MEPHIPTHEVSSPLSISSFKVFDVVPFPIFVIFQDGKLGYANLAAGLFFGGQPSQELLGRSFSSLLSSLNESRFFEILHSIFSSSSSGPLFFRCSSAHPSFDLQLSPLLNSYGLVEAALAIPFERNSCKDSSHISSDHLRALAAHAESSREQERAHIAREIHDEVGQALTCIGMDLSLLSKHLDSSNQEISLRLSGLNQLVKETFRIVRRISSDLRPSVLDDFGLGAALEWLASDFESRTQISCHVEIQEEFDIDSYLSTSLFRICQEVLSIISRNSQAHQVSIRVVFSDDITVLLIREDGLGTNYDEKNLSGGLGIRERVSLHRGTIEIINEQGQGTSLFFRFPTIR